MDRREMLGFVGAGAAGLAALAGGSASAQEPKHDHKHAEGDVHEKCAEACVDCEKECNQGFHHCFKQVQTGKNEHAKAMHLLADCGDICGTSGKLVARMSPLMTYTCRACGECCQATIAAVEALGDSEMKVTLEALRHCQQTCTEMVKAMSNR